MKCTMAAVTSHVMLPPRFHLECLEVGILTFQLGNSDLQLWLEWSLKLNQLLSWLPLRYWGGCCSPSAGKCDIISCGGECSSSSPDYSLNQFLHQGQIMWGTCWPLLTLWLVSSLSVGAGLCFCVVCYRNVVQMSHSAQYSQPPSV